MVRVHILVHFNMEIAHPNRIHARKKKPGGSCAMCKPWKHKWEHKFKIKEQQKRSIDPEKEYNGQVND